MEKYRFNVFGRIIAIERAQAQWRCFNVGADGKRAPALLAIPCDVTHAELAQYLYDIYHESAAASDQDIFEITPGTTRVLDLRAADPDGGPGRRDPDLGSDGAG